MSISETIWLALIPQLGALLLLLVQQQRQRQQQDYQATQLRQIKHQVEPNSGKSLADAVNRVESRLTDMDTQIRSLKHSGKRHIDILTSHIRDVEVEHEHDLKRLQRRSRRILEAHAATCTTCKTFLEELEE